MALPVPTLYSTLEPLMIKYLCAVQKKEKEISIIAHICLHITWRDRPKKK